jgi:branched-chain amino acid transport system ATP-binding protein
MADVILSVSGLDAFHGSAHVVQNVSLTVGRECVAVMGRNGAGKTTLARAIMGLGPPRATGLVELGGVSVLGKPAYELSRLGLGYVPQGRRLFPSLSVDEHLSVVARPSSGPTAWTAERLFALFPSLADRRHAPADRISGGERSMLAIGRALTTNPRCLILDEPTEGLAPAVVQRVCGALRGLAQAGVAILLIEQSLRAVEAAADRILILNVGRVVHEMQADNLQSSAEALEKHLGVAAKHA